MADWGLRIGIDGEISFQKAVQNINANIRLLNSELVLSESKFVANDKSISEMADSYSSGSSHASDLISIISKVRSELDLHVSKTERDKEAVQRWQLQLNKSEETPHKTDRKPLIYHRAN